MRAVTIHTLHEAKRAGEKIAMLTGYDASFARAADAAGVDIVLVGDSLGMVVQGQRSTLTVSLRDMRYHTRCVRRGLKRAFLLSDLPFGGYQTVNQALRNGTKLVKKAGAQMVKLEGAGPVIDMVYALSQREILVCGHLGLTPQSIHRLGGYKVQGRSDDQQQQLIQDAQSLEQAGAQLLVLECVPSVLGEAISQRLDIPVIGIGAGAACDGQVLVLHDILGLEEGRVPRFVKNFLRDSDGSVSGAIRAYVEAVKQGTYPQAEHSYD